MIDKAEIERVKRENNLVIFVQARGVKLRRKGKQYVGRCPFHIDNEPSFIVDGEKGLWNCLGACQEGGDIYSFLMKSEGIDFREAHERLGGSVRTQSNNAEVESAPAEVTVEQLQQLAIYVAAAHQLLLRSPQAQEYARSRGISLDTIRALGIGYSDGEFIDKFSRAGHQALKALGIVSKTGRDLFAGCLIFPLVDGASDQVVAIYGRSITGKEHRYLPGPRRGLFNPQGARNSDEVILVEGVIDAAALYCAQITNALPTYGTNGITDELLAYLQECRVREAVLMMDSDEAGRKAAERLATKLATTGINTRVVELPAKDPAEFISAGATAEQLRAIIANHTLTNSSPATDVEIKRAAASNDGAIEYSFYGREYEVRGLSPIGLDRLKVNIRFRADGKLHMDTLDLYQAKARSQFAEKVAKLINEKESVIESNLLEIAESLEGVRLEMRSNKKEQQSAAQMTPAEQREAIAYLKAPDLVNRIVRDAEQCGFVGERATILMGILATISRKLARPLSVLVVARSGAGKSSLQNALCAFVPPEDVVWVTRLTGQALFYKDPNSLKGKVLAIVEEGGATEAIYSLRNLASDQRLSIAVTQTNPQTGELHTRHYDIHGPVSIITTTTSPEAFDEETRSRFVLLTMDESRDQTRAILHRQREACTLAGVVAEAASESIKQLHHNVQRMLRPLKVVNPYVEQLSYPAERLIARREHPKYLTLINAIALLHQHQREIKQAVQGNTIVEYVEVELSDIALANELAKAVLWRSFDELAPPVRGMLQELRQVFAERTAELGIDIYQVQLSRREIRRITNWSEWQVKNYCQKLVELEYLTLTASGQGKPSLYRLLEPLEDDEPQLSALTLPDERQSD